MLRQILWPQIHLVRQYICKNFWQIESSEDAVNQLLRQILAPNSPLLSVRLQDMLVDKSSEENFGAKIHQNTGFISTVVDLSTSDE